jgi:peptidoglycan/LPS O-acetylase OafA/YrhL
MAAMRAIWRRREHAPSIAGRDVSLDAMRGIAALIVFAWHCAIGFFPAFASAAPSHFWFVAMNGQAAVAFFYFLSGFVLSRGFFLTGDARILVRGAIKRWPRLAGPVLLAVLFSLLLFKTNAYFFAAAAETTHSTWLAHFGGAYDAPFEPTLVGALLQGSLLTFLRGDSSYDSSLWTMGYEFYGSLLVYSLCFALSHFPARSAARGVAISIAAIVCHFVSPFLVVFVCGLALSAFLPERGLPSVPGFAFIAIPLALALGGYTQGAGGFYTGLTSVFPATIPVVYGYALGAAFLITAVESSRGLTSFLSSRWGRAIGELSFPFYLVHVLTLCSLGAFVLIATGSKFAAIVATLASSLAAAWLLAQFNRWWVATLNSWVAAIMGARRDRPLGAGTTASRS